MNDDKNFNCVQFQRKTREKLLKEAGNDIRKMAMNIKSDMKKNDLFIYFRKQKNRKKDNITA